MNAGSTMQTLWSDWTWLWIPAAIFAAAAQAGRNAIQRSLTEKLGTLGATQVRFLYGFPFAVLFAGLAIVVTGADWPRMNTSFSRSLTSWSARRRKKRKSDYRRWVLPWRA